MDYLFLRRTQTDCYFERDRKNLLLKGLLKRQWETTVRQTRGLKGERWIVPYIKCILYNLENKSKSFWIRSFL